jgi:hypothetical protein
VSKRDDREYEAWYAYMRSMYTPDQIKENRRHTWIGCAQFVLLFVWIALA